MKYVHSLAHEIINAIAKPPLFQLYKISLSSRFSHRFILMCCCLFTVLFNFNKLQINFTVDKFAVFTI